MLVTLCSSLFFYVNRLLFKITIALCGRHSMVFYPDYAKKHYSKLHWLINHNTRDAIADFEINSDHIAVNFNNIFIDKTCDSEEIELVHRFNWVMLEFSKCSNSLKQADIEALIVLWSDKYLCVNCTKKFFYAWESYTISDRISNIIFLISKGYLNDSKVFQYFLFENFKILISRLEFYGDSTSNHILNNSKALILYGIYLKNKDIIDFGYEIICREYVNHIYDNGELNEGSTHYQLLIAKWFDELNSCMQSSVLCKNYPIISIIRDKLVNFSYYIISNKSIALIGDISPDYSPEYLLTAFDNTLHECDLKRLYKIEFPFQNNLSLSLFENKFTGIIKHSFCNFVITTSNSINSNKNAGHHHDDFGVLDIKYLGHSIFVDPGRDNYLTKKMVYGIYHGAPNSHEGKSFLGYKQNYLPIKIRQKRNICYRLNNICMKCYGLLSFKKSFWSRIINIEKSEIIVSDIVSFHNFSYKNSIFYLSHEINIVIKTKNYALLRLNNNTLINFSLHKGSHFTIEDGYISCKYGELIKTNILNIYAKNNRIKFSLRKI